MAKTAKQKFTDTVQQHAIVSKQIAARQFSPLYLLMGDEPYFIDSLTNQLAAGILNEAERAFGQVVIYGKESEAGAVINLCRQMPMMGAYQVVIVKEAQALKGLEKLSLYTASPSPTTILVLCHKEKNVDKRWQLYKHFDKLGVVFESVAPRDYEIGAWLTAYVKSLGWSMEPKAMAMLTDYLGADIAKITNELGKLRTYLPQEVHTVTADHIEQNIGISKNFNNFELSNAMLERNMTKAMLIADHFARNPKEYPLLVTVSSLYTNFQRLFTYNYLLWVSKRKGTAMPSEMELTRMMKLTNAFFLKDYRAAATRYPNNKVFAILGLLRAYDLKSKGMDTGQADQGELLKELLLKIFVL